MKKRGNNEGSVYRREDGLWVAMHNLGVVGGKRRRKALYGNTQREVLEKLAKVRGDLERGVSPSDERLTVARYLQRWLQECVEPQSAELAEGTREGYADHVRLHIVPEIGHFPLAKLTPLHVQALIRTKLETPRKRVYKKRDGSERVVQYPPMKPRTVQYMHAVLRTALAQAVKWGLVARNVAALADAPSPKKTEAKYLEIDEAKHLLKAIAGTRNEVAFTVAVAVGLRRGEVSGLRWENVDLDAGTITIHEQLLRRKKKPSTPIDSSAANDAKASPRSALVISEPKSAKSKRTLTLPASLAQQLREHRKRQLQERLKAGPLWTDNGYVFTTKRGRPIEGRDLHRRWERAIKKAGLPYRTFHASRHTAASLLIAQGVDMKTVQEILGHSSFVLTADTYSHVVKKLKVEAASKMDAFLVKKNQGE